MASSLPSPPPHHSLAHTTLPVETVETLRSSVGQVLVAIEELQGLLSWGGEAGIVGWPSLLSSYQRLLSLLSLLSHHLNPPLPTLPPHLASSSSLPRLPTLSTQLIHPHLSPSGPHQEPWLQSLLSLSHSIHGIGQVPAAVGTVEEFEERRRRAGRVCELLGGEESGRDWRGRVGLLPEEGGEADHTEDADADGEDEDDGDDRDDSSEEEGGMFGSDDEDEGKEREEKRGRKRKRREEKEVKVEKKRLFEGKGMTQVEREKELERIVGFMRTGKR